MTFGSLFSGIGGIDLGLERAGMTCRWQVEIDEYCRKVLTKHWPNVPKYGDIRTISGNELERVDLIAGGFPCQDLSVAGKRAGIDGERSGLWAEYVRLIGTLRPRFVLIENVPGLLANESMRRVLGDLSALGYDAEWQSLRASDFGLHHRRERVFIVAYSAGKRFPAILVHERAGTSRQVRSRHPICSVSNAETHRPLPHDRVCGVVDGLSQNLYAIRGLGNAVVPSIAQWIGRRILKAAA
jgi:DNA (cytosine-5)-methyltransferase 1